jgi:hypothetical protein
VKEHAVFVRKAMALLLFCSTLLSGALPALAQSAVPAADSADSGLSLSECGQRGRLDARRGVSTSGSFLGGFVGGLLLGPVGGALAYAAQGRPDPPVPLVASLDGPDCELGYRGSYGETGRSWRRRAAVGGAMFGTAFFIVAIVIATGHRSIEPGV